MKKIFILNGSGGVGKDTFVRYVDAYITGVRKYFVAHISSIEPIKEKAWQIGWDGQKDEKGRKLLSDIKMALSEYNDEPFEYIKTKIERFIDDARIINGVLFIDIREPEEIDRVKQIFGCETILIKSDRVEQVTSNMADAGVYDYTYDCVIENNGTVDDLFDSAVEFSRKFIFKDE